MWFPNNSTLGLLCNALTRIWMNESMARCWGTPGKEQSIISRGIVCQQKRQKSTSNCKCQIYIIKYTIIKWRIILEIGHSLSTWSSRTAWCYRARTCVGPVSFTHLEISWYEVWTMEGNKEKNLLKRPAVLFNTLCWRKRWYTLSLSGKCYSNDLALTELLQFTWQSFA